MAIPTTIIIQYVELESGPMLFVIKNQIRLAYSIITCKKIVSVDDDDDNIYNFDHRETTCVVFFDYDTQFRIQMTL